MKLFTNLIKYFSILLLIPLVIAFIEMFRPLEWNKIDYIRFGFFSLSISLITVVLILFKGIDKEQFTKINIGKTALLSLILAFIMRFISDMIILFGDTNNVSTEGISYYSKHFPLEVLIIAPILEELAVRITIINTFTKKVPNWLLIVGTSLIFGLLHIGSIKYMIGATLMGVVLSYFFIKTRNALLLMLTHFFINLSTYIPREYYASAVIFFSNNMVLTSIIGAVFFSLLIINKEKYKRLIQQVSKKE